MSKKQILKIGFVPIRRTVFDQNEPYKQRALFITKFNEFKDDQVELIDIDDIVEGGIAYDASHIDKVVKKLKEANVSGVFFPHTNFGTEEVTVGIARGLNVPVLIWGNRDGELVNGIRLRDKILITFTSAQNKKVLVVLSDGDYNGTDPEPIATQIKNAGITIYSIGFMCDTVTMHSIASTNCYSTASSEDALNAIFDSIQARISAMVVDPAGSDFEIIASSVQVSGASGIASVLSNTLMWSPSSRLDKNKTVTITYKEKLKQITLGDNDGIYSDRPLNGAAKLIYSFEHDSNSYELAFPAPTADYQVGQITVKYSGLPDGVKPADHVQSAIITDFTAKKYLCPSPAMTIDDSATGKQYQYIGSTYESAGGSQNVDAMLITEFDAVAGACTLTHAYVEVIPEFNVTYQWVGDVPDGVALPDTASYEAGETVNAAENPSVSGWTFLGWTSDDVTITEGAFTMPDHHVVISGSFEELPELYSVTYQWSGDVPNGATLPDAASYEAGETVNVAGNPSVSGWRFLGWTSDDVTITEGAFTMPEQGVVLTGSFEALYTITFVDGVSDETITVPAAVPDLIGGQTFTLPTTVPTRTDYTFTGWKADSDSVVYQPGTSFVMPDQNVIMTAQWTLTDIPVTGEQPLLFAWILGGLSLAGALTMLVLKVLKTKKQQN